MQLNGTALPPINVSEPAQDIQGVPVFTNAGPVPIEQEGTSLVQRFIEDEKHVALKTVAKGQKRARLEADKELEVEENAARQISLTPMNAFEMKRIRWLWQDRIPMGEITLIVGRGGTGKSTILADLAAKITRGELEGEFGGVARSVLYVMNEDSPQYTVAPRLHAAGARLDMIFRVTVADSRLMLPRDCDRVAEMAVRCGAAAIMIDPLTSNLDTKNKNDQGQTRAAMERIREMCERANISAIGLAHTRKAMSTNLMDAIMGSSELGNVCRSAMGVMADPDADGEYLLSQEKANLGRLDVPSWRYRIKGHQFDYGNEMISTSRIEYLSLDNKKVSDMLADSNRPESERTGAAEAWLFEYLEQHGKVTKRQVVDDAKKTGGPKERTLERAYKFLNKGTPEYVSGTKSSGALWSLPANPLVSASATLALPGG